MKIHLLNCLLVVSIMIGKVECIEAQFNFDYNDSIIVKVGANTLNHAWDGGLNFVQLSEIDIDFDGDMDLFLFDRTFDNIRLYRNEIENNSRFYRKIQNAKSYFPTGLKYRVALLDYNNDGKNDIFTYGIGGLKVFKNIGNINTEIQWEVAKEIVYSDYNGDLSNLFISSTDIPAYVDVDGDTDIDVLTFDLSGQTVEYHKNVSMELYNHSDSLEFVLKNQCWGKFKEDALNSTITLNDQTSPCVGSAIDNPEMPLHNLDKDLDSIVTSSITRHTGSTLLALDIDNSGVKDLLLGDVSSSHLSLLINGGTLPNTNSAIISIDENFPSNSIPVNVPIFPAAFYLDVDFDGVKDLIVSGNAKNSSHNYSGIHFYKNFGSNVLPNFVFQSKNFLQGEMVEVGTAAIPFFLDVNADGLEDMLVANQFRYKEPLEKESVVSYFRNTGTSIQPELSYIESDFLGLAALNFGLRSVPTAGDLDGDGDKDLLIGIENGTLAYFKNNAGAGNPISLDAPISNYLDNNGNSISVGAYAFPQLFDLNKDGLLDLLVGKKTGEIAYYQNVGTTTIPAFSLVDDTLGSVDIAPFSPDGYNAPHFFDWNDTTYLFVGGSDGKLRFYEAIESNLGLTDTFKLISDFYKGIEVDAFSTCWVNDLDNDGNLDLYVGGILGGISRFEHNNTSQLNVVNLTIDDLDVFPNPFSNELSVSGKNDYRFTFTSLLGKEILKGNINNEKINTLNLPKGIYFLNVSSDKESFQKKVIKH